MTKTAKGVLALLGFATVGAAIYAALPLDTPHFAVVLVGFAMGNRMLSLAAKKDDDDGEESEGHTDG